MEEKDYILIENYLKGKLGDDEKINFENRLKNDPGFANAYTLEKSMDIYLQKSNNGNFVNQLKTIGKPFFQESPGLNEKNTGQRPGLKRFWLGMAMGVAAVGLLLVLSKVFFNPSLYDQYAQHRPLALAEKSQADNIVYQIETTFNSEDYLKSYELLSEYTKNNPGNGKAKLYMGIAALETNQYQESRKIFQALFSGSTLFESEAVWYTALSYIKEGRVGQAIPFLKRIPASDTMYYQKAKELLGKI